MKHWPMIAVLTLLVAWGVYLFTRNIEAPPETREVTARSDPSAAAQAEPEAHAKPERQAQVDEPATQEAQAKPAAPAPAPDAPPTPEPADEEADPEPYIPPPEPMGQVEVLEGAFSRSSRDADASGAESRIRDLLHDNDLSRDILIATTCRQTVCRIELEWSREHAEDYLGFAMKLVESFNQEMAIKPTSELGDDGTMQVELYVLREGYTLSDVSD